MVAVCWRSECQWDEVMFVRSINETRQERSGSLLGSCNARDGHSSVPICSAKCGAPMGSDVKAPANVHGAVEAYLMLLWCVVVRCGSCVWQEGAAKVSLVMGKYLVGSQRCEQPGGGARSAAGTHTGA